MKKVFKISCLLFWVLILFSCQKEVEENKQIEKEPVEAKKKTTPRKVPKDTISKIIKPKEPKKLKIDTIIWLKEEALVFKEISKAEFDQKYRSSNPSELLYLGNLKDFKQKYSDDLYRAFAEYSKFIMQQNLVKDSSHVEYKVYQGNFPQNPMANRTKGITVFQLEDGTKKNS